MSIGYRFTEACALMPMLFVPLPDPTIPRSTTILCLGTQAEKLAAECLRWRDVAAAHLLTPPVVLRDKRVVLGLPKAGSCSAVLTSPDEPGEAFLAALKNNGVYCVSTFDPLSVPSMLRNLRTHFPLGICPWRENLPEAIFGAMTAPGGVPKRQREIPGGARRLSDKYMKCLFTFAADETPLVFGPQDATKKAPVPPPPGPDHGQQPPQPTPPFG